MTTDKLNSALEAFVKADGKLATSALAYMHLAIGTVYQADVAADAASDLIEDICDKTGSRGKVTTAFPKGKANPNALKQNGYSGLAEASRLLTKVGNKLNDNDDVRAVVEAFLGVINNPVHYREVRDADKRVRAATAKQDGKALRRALRAARADYLAITYPDRPTTFNALRSALDKATASRKSQDVPAATDAETDAETETDVSDAAIVVGSEDMATALIAKVSELSDAALLALFDAVKAEMTARTEAEPIAQAA